MGAFEYTALDAQGRSARASSRATPRSTCASCCARGSCCRWRSRRRRRASSRSSRSAPLFVRRGLSTLDLALLTRQLATLLRSGLPLEESLQAVAEQTEKPRVQRIILGVRSKVVEGHPLADGLRDFPQAFPEIYRATVSAGEQSGKLDPCWSACRTTPSRARSWASRSATRWSIRSC